MKTKTLGLALLTAILLAGIVTALSFSASTPAAMTKSDSTATFTITNSDTVNMDVTLPASVTISDGTESFAVTPDDASFTVNAGDTHTVTLTRATVPEDFNLGAYTTSLLVDGVDAGNSSNTANRTVTVTYVHDFCEDGSINDDDLDMEVDITNRGEGDDNEWLPLDEIEVENNLGTGLFQRHTVASLQSPHNVGTQRGVCLFAFHPISHKQSILTSP